MNNMNKEFLKDLVFAALKGIIEEKNDDHFIFKYSPDKTTIDFSGTVEIVHGNTCYDSEDGAQSHEARDKTSLYFFDHYHINEVINNFRLYDNQVPESELWAYYDYKKEFYISESIEEKDEDAYSNHLKVKTLQIPVEEIADYLFNDKYMLAPHLLKDRLRDVNWTPELEAELQANILDNDLLPKKESIKKKKI